MLGVFAAWLVFYAFIWKGCDVGGECDCERPNKGRNRVIRLLVVYGLAVLGAGMALLIRGLKNKGEGKGMNAETVAGTVLLAVHAAIAALCFECYSC